MQEVEVDNNRALAELYGISHIPSFFIIEGGKVLKFEGRFDAQSFADFWKARNAYDKKWMEGWYHNPNSSFWAPVLSMAVMAENGQTYLAKELGLSLYAQIGVLVALVAVLASVWGYIVFLFLNYCFPIYQDSKEAKDKKTKNKPKKD